MIRVLYVNGNIMKRGGIEAFMMNYFRHIDSTKVHIDFLVHGYEKGAYDDEIIEAGSKIYHVPTKSRHPIKYQQELKKLFRTEHFDVIHSHLDAMSGWVLKVAKECGIPVRISHSHNTDHLTNNKLKRAFNEYAKSQIPIYATHMFACSEAAGKWLFGNAPFSVIHNAIDTKNYAFDKKKRETIRRMYGISDSTILLGHVGRFDTQKNHAFLIEMFAMLSKRSANYKLMCVGDGWLRKEIENAIQRNALEGKVILTGQQENAKDFYNAFDLYVFPSLFEGLGFALIEAQANGLTCVSSDAVPKETNLSGNDKMFYLPFEKEIWVSKLLELGAPDRYDGEKNVVKHGYDVASEAKKLENAYLKMSKRQEIL